MSESITLKTLLSASPKDVYEAWLDAAKHSEMTGAVATSDPTVGGKFTAWDGYITGTHLELEPEARIVQAWRTTEFPEWAPDSRLELVFEGSDDETHLTLVHTELPDHQGANYQQGWHEYYFAPMRSYFEAGHADAAMGHDDAAVKPKRKPASKKPAAKKPAAKKPVAAKKPAAKKPAPKQKPAAKKSAAKGKSVAKKKPAAAKKPAPKKKAAKK